MRRDQVSLQLGRLISWGLEPARGLFLFTPGHHDLEDPSRNLEDVDSDEYTDYMCDELHVYYICYEVHILILYG